MWNFEEILSPSDNLTEGPVWTGTSLLVTDGKSDRILEINPESKRSSVWFSDTQGVNGLNFNSKGQLFGCEQRGRKIVQYLKNDQKIKSFQKLSILNLENQFSPCKINIFWSGFSPHRGMVM